MIFQRDERSGEPLRQDPTEDRLVRYGRRRPLPPKSFLVELVGEQTVRCTITDWDRNYSDVTTGATRYDILWAESVDDSTATGRAAGFARSRKVGEIGAPGVADQPASTTIEGYVSGFFYCIGVAHDLERSEFVGPRELVDGDGGVPEDVLSFRASESGEVQADGQTVMSKIAFSCITPDDEKFIELQLVFKDPRTGDLWKGPTFRRAGPPGSSISNEIIRPPLRYKGTGSISISIASVTGSGTKFLEELSIFGLIECRGTVATIDGVATDTVASIAVSWSGQPVTSVSDWWIIPRVLIYAVSVGRNGAQRGDITGAPFVSLLLDGELSKPIAPTLEGAVDVNGFSTLGEVNRLEWEQIPGTEVETYHLYRGTGSGVAFNSCTEIGTRTHDRNAVAGSTRHIFDDTDFSVTQKETGQIFSYYLIAQNSRGKPSDASNRLEIACRLNGPESGDPSIPARSGILNILYNAAFAGTAGNDVDSADLSQDSFNNTGGPHAGFTRWHGTVFGGAVTRPKWRNSGEMEFAPPGVGAWCYAYQNIAGWNGATQIIRKGAVLTVQALIRHGGVLPNGSFVMYLESYNGATFNEFCPKRYRDPADDALKFYASEAALVNNALNVNTGGMLSSWTQFFAIFRPTESFTMDLLRVTWGWADGTVGKVFTTQPMLSFGEEYCNWTGQMIDTDLRYPSPTNPVGPINDGPKIRTETW